MGWPRENGTAHSMTLLHNMSCLHSAGESENQCREVDKLLFLLFYSSLRALWKEHVFVLPSQPLCVFLHPGY